MNNFIRTFLSSTLLLVLSACIPGTPTQQVIPGSLKLEVRTQNGATTFSQVGELINYLYVVHNSTGSVLQGPVTITDGTRQVACPALNTVGNLNDALDLEEEIVCPYQYAITESDFNTGSVTNLATATVGGVTSNQDAITLTRVQSGVLTLTKVASPTSYAQVGQVINYTYTITNLGTTPLGPTQFVINDNKLTAPLNCGPADTTLAPNQPINCAATYSITQADMGFPNVTNTATASGAGQVSAAVTATVTNTTLAPTLTPTLIVTQLPSGSTCPTSQQQKVPNSTCLHQVAKGEWLIQIGRCYGVSLDALISANSTQIRDPSLILPSMLLTVPNLGSAGTPIYGSPCIIFVTVQSGDTFPSLAQRYNAREDVLRLANPGGLLVGQPARIPLNSAGGTSVTAVPGATPTPTATTTAVPAQRITIPPGQTSLPIAGIVNPMQSVTYVIAATAGQVLSVNLSGIPNTEATLGVTGPTGLALKPQDGNFNWNTTVTTAGDHIITVTSLIGGSSRTYTLTVGLTAPVAPATPTNTPTTPIP
jgi:LysM repeat protein